VEPPGASLTDVVRRWKAAASTPPRDGGAVNAKSCLHLSDTDTARPGALFDDAGSRTLRCSMPHARGSDLVIYFSSDEGLDLDPYPGEDLLSHRLKKLFELWSEHLPMLGDRSDDRILVLRKGAWRRAGGLHITLSACSAHAPRRVDQASRRKAAPSRS
jgi:hypothetical protein